MLQLNISINLKEIDCYGFTTDDKHDYHFNIKFIGLEGRSTAKKCLFPLELDDSIHFFKVFKDIKNLNELGDMLTNQKCLIEYRKSTATGSELRVASSTISCLDLLFEQTCYNDKKTKLIKNFYLQRNGYSKLTVPQNFQPMILKGEVKFLIDFSINESMDYQPTFRNQSYLNDYKYNYNSIYQKPQNYINKQEKHNMNSVKNMNNLNWKPKLVIAKHASNEIRKIMDSFQRKDNMNSLMGSFIS